MTATFLLDLVALGIVADVMVQVDDTRYLLQRGLAALRENQRLGLKAILERAQIPAAELNEGHIGFRDCAAPECLGAARRRQPGGRIADDRVIGRGRASWRTRWKA